MKRKKHQKIKNKTMKKMNQVIRLSMKNKVIWPEFSYYTRGFGHKKLKVDLNEWIR
jgi:hypothetical protein